MAQSNQKREVPTLPHVGDMYKNFIEKRSISQAALARAMGKNLSVVFRYRERPSLQAYLLWELSHILKHNFFLDIAAQLPKEFTTNAPDPTLEYQKHIKELEEEIKTLRTQKETLESVLRQG